MYSGSENLLDQHLSQRIDSFFLIRTFCDQADAGTFGDAHGQHAQQTLCIDAALFHFDPNAGLEFTQYGGRGYRMRDVYR